MPAWTSDAAAILDLRVFLHDGPSDHLVKSKKALGPVDGVNCTFYTLEQRLVVPPATTSIIPASGILVTVDMQPASVVTPLDDPVLGQFTINSTTPAIGSDVRAGYYFQQFFDSDLDAALREAGGVIQSNENYLLIEDGLKPAAIRFGASFALSKLAIRWLDRLKDVFVLEDKPTTDDTTSFSALCQQTADRLFDQALKLRDDFYTRQGRRNQPAWTRVNARIPIVGTNR